MAILAAFNSPEVEVIGLTTIFGNVPTAMATRNALHLVKLTGHPEVGGADWGRLSTVVGKEPRTLNPPPSHAVPGVVHAEGRAMGTELPLGRAAGAFRHAQVSRPSDDPGAAPRPPCRSPWHKARPRR